MPGLFDACPMPRKAVTLAPVTRKAPAARSDLADALSPADRRLVEKMAADAGAPVDCILPEIVAAYLRLLRDVPAALPRDPMRGLSIGAAARAGRSK